MPRLYLFRITQTTSGSGRRVAILTKADKDPELSKINQGELTNYFDHQKLPRDGVDYKGSIEVGEDNYDKVIKQIEKYGKNPALTLVSDGGKFILGIGTEKVLIASFATQSRNYIEYPFVFIK